MENKEYVFKGTVINGFVMLFVTLALAIAAIVGVVFSIIQLDGSDGACGGWFLGGSIMLLPAGWLLLDQSFLRSEKGIPART